MSVVAAYPLPWNKTAPLESQPNQANLGGHFVATLSHKLIMALLASNLPAFRRGNYLISSRASPSSAFERKSAAFTLIHCLDEFRWCCLFFCLIPISSTHCGQEKRKKEQKKNKGKQRLHDTIGNTKQTLGARGGGPRSCPRSQHKNAQFDCKRPVEAFSGRTKINIEKIRIENIE